MISALYKEQLLRQQAADKAAKANFKPKPEAFPKLLNFPLKNVPVDPKLPVTSQTYVPPYYQNCGKHGGLPPPMPFVPPSLPSHPVGDTAAKDIKIELIAK